MGTLSDQIRQFIEQSGTTRYEIARAAGVSEAVLSRFMSKRSGLTLDTLDKLADVLGLRVIQTVQAVNRPKPKGRKPAKRKDEKKMIAAKARTVLDDTAYECARSATEDYFESRRGIYELDCTVSIGKTFLVYYNNNPYAIDENLRPEETERIRKRLRKVGIKESAYAECEDGYTFAMLLDLGVPVGSDAWKAKVEVVGNILTEEVKATFGDRP
jgi:transcriptional regulator with XRE-family HTH domain